MDSATFITLLDNKAYQVIYQEYLNDNVDTQWIYDVWHSEDMRRIQRLNHVLDRLKKYNPQCMKPYHRRLINQIPNYPDEGWLRNILRFFHDINIEDEEDEGLLYEYCSGICTSLAYPIACKVFALKYTIHTALKYPELKNEVAEKIHILTPDPSPGVQSALRYGRKLLSLNPH